MITLGVATSSIIEDQVESVAAMLISAAPEHYALLPDDSRGGASSCVVSQLFNAGTEFENIFCIHEDGVVAGLVAHYPTAEIVARKQKSLRELIRMIPGHLRGAFMAAASAHSRDIPEAEAGAIYLARVAVSAERQGRGLGKLLLERFLEQLEAGSKVALHVNAQNLTAIRLYHKLGFAVSGQPNTAYLLMTREVSQLV